MPQTVVRLLEVVEVEEHEREPAAVTAGPGGLGYQPCVERAVVEEPGERIAPGAIGELRRHAVDVGEDAAVDDAPRLGLAVALQDACDRQQLGGDLGGREPEALALAREVGGELAGVVALLQGRDERRKGAELAQSAQPLEGRHDPGRERLVDAFDGEVPRRQPHDPLHALQRTGGVG